jgi:hypothetical protein
MNKTRVAVFGTGDVGRVLATGFLSLGNDVMMGSRDAQNPKLRAWVEQNGERASGGRWQEAARFGELIVLATLGIATEQILLDAGVDQFAGKVVIDTTNPLDFSTGAPALSIGHTDSLGELIQRTIPDAKVVKAFNTVGNALMVRPDLPGGPPDMFICGNDDGAKRVVADILHEFGWGVVDIGGIDGSRYLEPMCLTWVRHGLLSGTWMHAFKLLRK